MRTVIQVRRGNLGTNRRVRALATTMAVVAVLLPSAIAVARPAAAAVPTAHEASDTYPRTPLWVYGHSYTTSPGTINTPGQEWMPKLAEQLGLPRWRTFGVGSSRIIDTYGDLARQAVRGPVRGSTWDPARRGVVVLQSEFNDALNPAPRGADRAVRLTATAAGNYGQTLQAGLAVLASSARVDWSAARSTRGWTSSSGSAYLGGSLVYTTTPGAYRELTVDVGASGTVWLVTWEVSRGLRNPRTGATAISVDGRLRHVIPPRTASWESIWSRRSGGYQHPVGPRATKISGLTPGRHVIRVAKSDRGPGAVYLDQLLVQAAAPLPVVVVKDPAPLTTGNWITTPSNQPTVVANRQLLHSQIDAVTRQFPNVATVLLDVRPGYIGRDGVHLSDLGMEYEAGLLAQRFREFARTYDVPVMYE
jgi:hypothetical protein